MTKNSIPHSISAHRRPHQPILLSLLLVGALVLTGCWQQRVLWSPDGKWALVVSNQGLFVSDADGNLSESLLADVSTAAWLKDSKGVILARRHNYSNWDMLDSELDAGVKAAVEVWAAEVRTSLNTVQTWNDIFDALQSRHKLESDEITSVKLLLRDLHGEELKRLKPGVFEKLDGLDVDVISVWTATVEHPQLSGLKQVAGAYLSTILEFRVNPSRDAVAYTTFRDHPVLRMTTLTDTPSTIVVSGASTALSPDWTPDGNALIYIQSMHIPDNDDDIVLGVLKRRAVFDDSGQLALATTADDLAGMVFDIMMSRVRCLSDGRILFSATPLHLPLTLVEAPEQQQLYMLDPERQSTTTEMIPQSKLASLPDHLGWFEVSPDEKQIMFIGSKGRVFVFTMATGKVKQVQRNGGDGDMKSIPDWRAPDELCYVQIPKKDSTTRQEVVLRKPNGTIRVLSGDWPEEARDGVVE